MKITINCGCHSSGRAYRDALLVQSHKPIEDAAKAAANAPIKIISFQKDDISKLEIKRKNGEVVDLSRTSPASWKITSPNP